tara:strand:+ start:83852 stop:84700 length:849 start_codon:yes stop_codon:yes gene_type:complete
MNHKKNVLTIAGSDSSGGAGIQADIKTFEALNTYSATVITSVTAQNTLGVQHVFDLPDDIIAHQLDSVFSDITFSAVKIGMLKKQSYIEIVAKKLRAYAPLITVLDPVMVSSSGHRLLDENAVLSMTQELFPLVTIVTPNIPEAAALLNKQPAWIEANLKEACKALIETFSLNAVLLKGGHLKGSTCEDTLALITQNNHANSSSAKKIKYITYPYQKIVSSNTHGTGCTLASAIAAYMVQNITLEVAVKNAGTFLQSTLNAAHLQKVGSGTGPLNHHAVSSK